MGAEAKRYLQDHSIPQLFEGLMTGLIYNRPSDPLQFLEGAIAKVRQNPGLALKWDSFVDEEARAAVEKGGKGGEAGGADLAGEQAKARVNTSAMLASSSGRAARESSQPARKSPSSPHQLNGTGGGTRSRQSSHSVEKAGGVSASRPSSLAQAAQMAKIAPDAPIILFMGGPGGGKTRYAAQLQEQLRAEGLVHICMPDLVRTAIARYKDRRPEWRLAAERYQRGELIPNELAQQLVKAEMGRHPSARIYFLEGFPREARQVEDFERNVRPVDMALILDYDEEVLRRHMQSRGLLPEVVERRINEFKQKTLPSAKYFDDQRLLHLIPGEKEDAVIIERMRKLALRAVRAGVQGGGGAARASAGASTSASSAAGERNGPLEEGEKGLENGGVALAGAGEGPSGPAMAEAEDGGSQGQGQFEAAQKETEEPAIGGAEERRLGTAGTGEASKTGSKPVSAGTTKSTSAGPSRAIAALPQQEVPPSTAEPIPQRSGSSATKKSGPNSAASAGRVQSGKETRQKASSREGSGKSQPGVSSAVSTPKPGEGPFRELLANSVQPAAVPTPTASALATDSDGFPQGLPSEAPVILLIGAPGSNKSKFGQRVARKYDGFVPLSMGELFRRKVLQNGEDELWTRIGKKMDAGETIPTRICRELLYTALHERGQNGWGYVIEGYPRTLQQAEDIEAQLGRLDLAILIDCTEQFCRDSLRRRYQKDKEEGAERADDDEGVVRVRLSLFKQNTLPMLKYLDDKGLLRVVRFEGAPQSAVMAGMMHKIEGDTNEDKVFQEICSIIDNTIFIQDDGNGKSLGSGNSVEEGAEEQQNAPAEQQQQASS